MTPIQALERTSVALLGARVQLGASLIGSRANERAREFAMQGLYLTAVRSFEGFLEDQLLALASGKVTWKSRVLGPDQVRCQLRLQERRKSMIKEIMLARKDYVDFLPYEQTIKIANVFFVGGRPFSKLPEADRRTLVRCLAVRNFIAHRSDAAARKFLKRYEDIKPVRLSSPRPIHYLDDSIRAGVTLFEHDISSLVQIGRKLS